MEIVNTFGNFLSRWVWMFSLGFGIVGILGLGDVSVLVPRAVRTYDTVTLRCDYDLEGDLLYSIKWYKGPNEFFRYIPKETPSMMVFSIPGINVDLSKSNANELILRDVQPKISGRYKCEVTSDAPNFYTKMAAGMMYVIDVPHENPILHIQKEVADSAVLVTANCSAPPSFPPMNITWYINGLKVDENGRKVIPLENNSIVKSSSHYEHRQYMTVSYLSKELNENVFQGGVIKVQCVSWLFHLYRSEDVRYIDDDRPKPWPSSVIGVTQTSGGSMNSYYNNILMVMLYFGYFIVR
ncbi:uncharacterized protein LOC115876432 [Sitophilus oryzae]|uniref:Uncharacterized protein LOC115876432 n=1 Tax=Sitophilus oryzae TaxID=7048 RepID=A0A6J2XB66_SITOR|nr:uncharacterized protein LOC115876432 [Sitophilus oryzae]